MGNPLVLHVIAARGMGGAEAMLVRLAGARRSRPFRQVVVNLMQDPSLEAAVRGAGVEYEELGLRGVPQVPATLWSLTKLIRRLSPDAIQSWMYYADLMALRAADWSGRRSSCRVYWGVRCSDLDFSQYRPLLRWVAHRCARLSARPDAIVFNSVAGQAAHRRLGYSLDRSVVIANGIDTGVFRPDQAAREQVRQALGIAPGERLVIHVGRFDPMKDHQAVIETARLMPDARFVLVGRETEGLARTENITSLGVRADMPALYAAADILLSASKFGEGFPNVIAEAMACGLPAVATDVGDSALIVGDTGIVVAPSRPDRNAAALRALLDETDDARRRRAAAARHRIEANYGLDRAVAAFDRLHVPDTDSGRQP